MYCLPTSVIIPNWNGEKLLERHLCALLEEMARYDPASECIVVDDGSTDDSVGYLRKNFPMVQVIQRSENRGFSSAVNAGIEAAKNERVLLINNDVAVTAGFLGELCSVFDQAPDTFAVASLQEQERADGSTGLDGFNTMRWRKGHLEFENCTASVLAGKPATLAFCTAGCSLFSREKLRTIGGFCEIFDPFYSEDAEVSLQAARRGWRLAFAPHSIVHHQYASSSRRKRWALRFVPVRNYFFLHWLTLDSSRLWISHVVHVAGRLVWWSLQGRVRYAAGFVLAILKLPEVIRWRRRRSRDWRYQMQDILSKSD